MKINFIAIVLQVIFRLL